MHIWVPVRRRSAISSGRRRCALCDKPATNRPASCCARATTTIGRPGRSCIGGWSQVCTPTNGVSRACAVRAFRRRTRRQSGITKASNGAARRMLLEAAWSYRVPHGSAAGNCNAVSDLDTSCSASGPAESPPVQVIHRRELSRRFAISGERPLSGHRRRALNVFGGRRADIRNPDWRW